MAPKPKNYAEKVRIEPSENLYFVDLWTSRGWKNDSSHKNLTDAERRRDALREVLRRQEQG